MTLSERMFSRSSNSTHAVVLHTVSDAEHYLSNSLNFSNDSLLFTTTPSVEYYSRRHDILCPCLSCYVTVDQMQANINMARRAAQKITASLDTRYAPILGNISGTGYLRFFKALYEYRIYIQLVDYLNLQNAIIAAIEKHGIVRFGIYNAKKNQYFDTSADFASFLSSIGITETLVVDIDDGVPYRSSNSGKLTAKWKLISHALGSRRRLWAKIGLESGNLKNAILDLRPAPSAIFFDSHDSLMRQILVSQPGRNRLISSAFAEKYARKYRGEEYNLHLDISAVSCDTQLPQQILSCILRDIEDDYFRNHGDYISYLKGVRDIVSDYQVRMGIWQYTPVFGKSALFHEYLMAQGFPVVGFQHGGLFANQFNHEIEISDFSRCTHYVSYGLEYGDALNIHGTMEACPVVVPLGKARLPDQHSSKQSIDILFPITNTCSMLEFGMCRQRPDILAERQTAILKYLNSKTNLRSLIKPLPNVSNETLAAWDELKQMKNLQLVYDVMLPRILMEVAPKVIIIEHPSTPLYDCLSLDADIFMLNDMVRPIERSALERLRKRVYYFEDVDELLHHLDLFFDGKLPSLRNTEFYDRYVMRGNIEEGLANLFSQLLAAKN